MRGQRAVKLKELERCQWARSPEIFHDYHDREWGVPSHDDQYLFEMLNLEGAQAGLSWLTVLRRREGYRRAFAQFDAKKLARFSEKKKQSLMKDDGIIRNRLKIHAVVENAKAFLAVQKEFGTFDRYIWSFVDGKPLLNSEKEKGQEKAEILSQDLKTRGFRFVGPTICYAYMQAVGLINDHTKECFRYPL